MKEQILEALEELESLSSIYHEWWMEYLYDENSNPVEENWSQKSLNSILDDIEDQKAEIVPEKGYVYDDEPVYYYY